MKKIENLSIRNFNDKEFERLTELSQTTYPGREISNSNYLHWEYLQNPDGNAIITVGDISHKIVSQYIVLPRLFSIDKKLIPGSLSVNTLTHPDFRGNNIFEKLALETFNRCKQENIFFTIGFPNPVSHPIINKKQIFETSGHLSLLLKPFNPISTLFSYFKNKKEKTGHEIELIFSDKILPSKSDVAFFDWDKDAGKYEEFLKKFNDEKQNVTFRSLKFLKWRYLNIPRRKYFIFKQESENKIKAIVIVRAKYIYGIRCGILVDLMTHSKSDDVKILLNAINEIARNNKLDLIFSAIPSHSLEFKLLKGAGFYSFPKFLLPQKLAFIVKRHLAACPDSIADFRKWFLTFGDYDIF